MKPKNTSQGLLHHLLLSFLLLSVLLFCTRKTSEEGRDERGGGREEGCAPAPASLHRRSGFIQSLNEGGSGGKHEPIEGRSLQSIKTDPDPGIGFYSSIRNGNGKKPENTASARMKIF